MTAALALAPTALAPELPASPYPGLRPFEKPEWPIFFGREAITDEVIGLLIDQHLVAVHGSSGSGKSSLIHAGVLPRLEQDHASTGLSWRTCAMVPGNAPLRNLAEALASLRGAPANAEAILAILRILNRGRDAAPALAEMLRHGPGDHLCLLLDQFEELFGFARANREEAALFADILVGLAKRPPDGLYAVLTMRSEFLGDCARFPGLAETVNKTQYLLPRMGRTDLIRAVREPATLYGGEVSRELAEWLIADGRSEQDELPLVQHGLMLLWREARMGERAWPEAPAKYDRAGLAEAPAPFLYDEPHESTLTPLREDPAGEDYAPEPWPRLQTSDYAARGGLASLLSDHADSVLAAAAPNDTHRRIVEHLFRALTEINAEGHAIRRRQTLAQLCAVTGAASKTLLPILDVFRADGVSFLRPYGTAPIGPETEIEISHEALIRCWRAVADPKEGWLQREFRDGLAWRALLVSADRFEQDPDNVLAPAPAQHWSGWLDTLPSPAWTERWGGRFHAVKTLIDTSLARADAERREEEERRRREVEEQLRRERERLEQRRRQRLIFSVVAALGLVAVVVSALASYAWIQRENAVAQAGEAFAARATADAERTTAIARTQELQVINSLLRAQQARDQLAKGLPVTAVQLALRGLPANPAQPDRPWNAEAAGALTEALARLRDFLRLSGHEGSVQAVSFASTGGLASAGADGTVRLWDAAGGRAIAKLEVHTKAIRSVAFSPDGSRLASGSADNTVVLWDVAGRREIGKLEGHSELVESVAFSPDGSRLASGSDDSTVRLWDVTSGREIARLDGHGGDWVRSVAFSPGRIAIGLGLR